MAEPSDTNNITIYLWKNIVVATDVLIFRQVNPGSASNNQYYTCYILANPRINYNYNYFKLANPG